MTDRENMLHTLATHIAARGNVLAHYLPWWKGGPKTVTMHGNVPPSDRGRVWPRSIEEQAPRTISDTSELDAIELDL